MCGLIRVTAREALMQGLPGWCQSRYHEHEHCVRNRFHRVRRTSRAKPEQVEAYPERCQRLIRLPESTPCVMAGKCGQPGQQGVRKIGHFLHHAKQQADLVDRWLLQGKRILQEEKVFPIFEPHTRWIAKSKAGTRGTP